MFYLKLVFSVFSYLDSKATLYHNEWEQRPLYLICYGNIAISKEYWISWIPKYSAKLKLKNLITSERVSKNKILLIRMTIAKFRCNSFFNAEFIKSGMLKAINVVCPEVKSKVEAIHVILYRPWLPSIKSVRYQDLYQKV